MRATLHSSKVAADHRRRFAVHGTAGSWVKEGLDTQEQAALAGVSPGASDWGIDPVQGTFTLAGNPAARTAIDNRRGNYGAFWKAVADAILHGDQPPVSIEQALATMTVLETALASASQARTLRLG